MDIDIFDALKNCGYEAKSGLTYINQFTFIIAVLLSAQAQDSFVNTQTPDLFSTASDAESMYALGLDRISEYVKRIGFWRNKAKNIYALSQKVIGFKDILKKGQQHQWFENICASDKYIDSATDGEVAADDFKIYSQDNEPISDEGLPNFRAGLMLLPGIGRKSANVFLNVMYKASVFPVDTHVIRLTNRLGFSETKDPYKIEQILKDIVPEKYAKQICHWLVWHGRKVCDAKKPKCEECPLKDYCYFYNS